MSINSLARDAILALEPYSSARKIGGTGMLYLNANECAFAPDFAQHIAPNLNRYPDDAPQDATAAYARYAGVDPSMALITRGGDEGIDLVMRVFCDTTDAVLYCPPTYGMYEVSAKTYGLETITVPQIQTDARFVLDMEGITAALLAHQHIKVVFVCHPNNPTGTPIPQETLEDLLALTQDRAVLVVDEAYIEYSKAKSAVDYMDTNPHLVIVRTLSKAFALAGIRVGFLLAHPDAIALFAKAIAPYPIPTPSAHLALEALSLSGIAQMRAACADALTQKSRLVAYLKAHPQVDAVLDSDANFVLARFLDGNGLFNTLWDKGIILRNQGAQIGLNNCIRITLGTSAQMDVLMCALEGDTAEIADKTPDADNADATQNTPLLLGLAPSALYRPGSLGGHDATLAPDVFFALKMLNAHYALHLMDTLDAPYALDRDFMQALLASQGIATIDKTDAPYAALIAHESDESARAFANCNDIAFVPYEIDAFSWAAIAAHLAPKIHKPRIAKLQRTTHETDISVHLNLDEIRKSDIQTGVGFFDHMLDQIATHGGFYLKVHAKGDLHIDDHHTVEDVALALGEALKRALGDKRGINRFGFVLPMDECRARCTLDLSGRPYLKFDAKFKQDRVGGFSTELCEHFFYSLSYALGATLHLKVKGKNTHHKIEALFKVFGRTLRTALAVAGTQMPSSKGVL